MIAQMNDLKDAFPLNSNEKTHEESIGTPHMWNQQSEICVNVVAQS
jgi:hypothetical protein